jgi:hypothetical protein
MAMHVAMNQWANYLICVFGLPRRLSAVTVCQRQVRRAFMVEDGPTISSSKIYEWAFARRQMLGKPLTTRHRYSVWRVLKTLGAEPIGRVGPRHAILWRLPDDIWARWRWPA